jgi:chromosome segregation ATPase
MYVSVFCLFYLGHCASSNAFVIGRQNLCAAPVAPQRSATAILSSSHKENNVSGDVDEKITSDNEKSIFNLNQQLQEKDLELLELRAELDSVSALLQQKEHSGRQFNEYYPLFCEQMAEKKSEVEELKKTIVDLNEKLKNQEGGGGSNLENDPVQPAAKAKRDEEILKFEQKIQDYQMQLAFSSHDLAAKDSQIEDLKEQLVQISSHVESMERDFADDYKRLQEITELEMEKANEEIDRLKNLLHSIGAERPRKEHDRLEGFDVSDTQLTPCVVSMKSDQGTKPHFLEQTISRDGLQVKSTPNDVIRWE